MGLLLKVPEHGVFLAARVSVLHHTLPFIVTKKVVSYLFRIFLFSLPVNGLRQRYQRLQNMAIRHMLGAFKGSPARALELEAALPPPEIRFEKQCDRYALRALGFQTNHPVMEALSKVTEDELGEGHGKPVNIAYILEANTQLLALLQRVKKLVKGRWNIEKPYAEWEAPWTTFPAEFIVSKRTKEAEAEAHAGILENIQLFEGDTTKVYYTDGSQKDSATSAAVCRITEEGGFDLAKYWSLGKGMEIADAEVFARAKALTIESQSPDENTQTMYIFVDSQAAIARIQNCRGNRTIQQATRAATTLRSHGISIYIQWCPSHMGIAGNEMADMLAKEGVEQSQPKHNTTISLGHLKRMAKKEVAKEWQKLWYNQEKEEERGRYAKGLGRTYRLITRDSLVFNLQPNPIIAGLPKNIVSAYIQLKTGKGLLKSFQYTLGNTLDDKCFCSANKRQNTQHLLLECKAYQDQRARLKKQLKGIPLRLNVLFCTAQGLKALAWFIQETGVCTVGWQGNNERGW